MSRIALRVAIPLGVVALSSLLAVSPVSAAPADVVCRFADPRLTEISGMATSLIHPDTIYLHNDSSGGPFIYAASASTCRVKARLRIAGATARDFEGMAVGRDKVGRPVIWIGDVGDNLDSWSEVTMLRVREPQTLTDRTMRATAFRFTYRDRPHNAETVLADPRAPRLWVVTKQMARGSLYALPSPLRKNILNKAREIRTEGGIITDGAISPKGDRYVLRDYFDAVVYQGLPPGREITRIYLPAQPQGESITWSADGGSLLIASERDDRLLRVRVP
jgi:hypothetical protein